MAENEYEDMIELNHYEPRHHPRMSMDKRAAQFAPFAALTGYEAVIQESARLTDRRVELDEGEIEEVNRRLQIVREHLTEQPQVKVTYFVPDQKKDGGAYHEITGIVTKIDIDTNTIWMEETSILMEQIIQIESEMFSNM